MRTRLKNMTGCERLVTIKGLYLFLFMLMLLTAGTGCRLVHGAADIPRKVVCAITPEKPNKGIINPVEVQQELLRFVNEFSTGMILGVDGLQRGTNAIGMDEMLRYKIALGTKTCSIASGPNAVANLLDMTAFVTVMRFGLEDHWQPKVFGESARPLLERCRNSETDIWRLASKVLTPTQQTELHRAIELWHQQNPLPESVLAARAQGFALQVAQASQADTTNPKSVFRLLMMDPLSSIDPAVREIAQTRLFAERSLYVAQKMPELLRWQAELLSVQCVEMPAVQQLVTNSTQVAASIERFADVAEKLPGQVSAEREEILKALQAQEKSLTPLVSEVRETLTAGAQMSASLNTTFTTFDALMTRFGMGDTNRIEPQPTNVEPIRIQDYTQTAAQLEATARQLTELLIMLDKTIGSTNLLELSTRIFPMVQQAKTGGKEIVDYAFWKGILLVVIVLLTALIYRFLSSRMISKK